MLITNEQYTLNCLKTKLLTCTICKTYNINRIFTIYNDKFSFLMPVPGLSFLVTCNKSYINIDPLLIIVEIILLIE